MVKKKISKRVILMRKIHELILRMKVKKKSFTIISQNCVGGVLYHMLNMPFLSPTINLFLEDENFVKLAENPKHYFTIEPKPFMEHFVEPADEEVSYPLIKIDDIIVCCRHYKSCKEAINAWNRRRQRIDYDNIYVIAMSWNLHENEVLIKRLEDLPYPKVIFTYSRFDYPNCIHLKGDKWRMDKRGLVRPAIPSYAENGYMRNFETLFDLPKWLNSGIVLSISNSKL